MYHAGAVQTGLQSNWPGAAGVVIRLIARAFFRHPRDGAQTVVYCAAVPDKEADRLLRGKLVVDCVGRNVDLVAVTKVCREAEKLWTIATDLCDPQRSSTSDYFNVAMTTD